jgi:hypothetical protein
MITPDRASARPINFAYWLPTLAVFAAFAFSGVAMALGFAPMVEGMAHLGYPDYFLPLLAAWKIAGAVVIVAPGLRLVKEWAYAGIMFDLTGAVVSRLSVGDTGFDLILPLILIVITSLSWLMRPAERRLATPRGAW